jgi:hypothetical protein
MRRGETALPITSAIWYALQVQLLAELIINARSTKKFQHKRKIGLVKPKKPRLHLPGVWHLNCRGVGQFEYAPEESGEPGSDKPGSPGSRYLRDQSVGWVGGATYANNQHRSIIDAKGL